MCVTAHAQHHHRQRTTTATITPPQFNGLCCVKAAATTTLCDTAHVKVGWFILGGAGERVKGCDHSRTTTGRLASSAAAASAVNVSA